MKQIIKILKTIFFLGLTLSMLIFIYVVLMLLLEVTAEHFKFGYNIADTYHCPNYLLNMLVPALAYLVTYFILFIRVGSKKMFMILLFLPTLWYLWMFGASFTGDIHDIGPGAIELPNYYELILLLGVNIVMFVGLGWMFKSFEVTLSD